METALHMAITAPTRRLHSRRLAWSRPASTPAGAWRILAHGQGAQEMGLTERGRWAWMAAVIGGCLSLGP